MVVSFDESRASSNCNGSCLPTMTWHALNSGSSSLIFWSLLRFVGKVSLQSSDHLQGSSG